MADRLGEILARERACTPEAVRDALKNQIIFGGRLGTNLLEVHAVKEEALAHALGRQHAIPALSGDLRLDEAATGLLAADVADRCDAVPYILADRRLAVLVVDPRDLASLDEVAFATGKAVHPIVVPEARVWALLRQTYGIDRHLRGIDVAFANLGAPPPRERERGSLPEATGGGTGGADLMGEGDFDALYSKPMTSAAAPPAPAPPARPSPAAPEPGATPFGGRAPGAPPPAPPVPPDEVIELTDFVEPAPAEPPARPPPPPPPAPGAPPALAPEVLAALSQVPGRAPGAAAPRRREDPEPSPLGFDEAVRFLEGVDDRNAIAKTVLRYARSRFRRAVLFTVHRGAARGWAGLGEKLGAVRAMSLPLGSPGIVDTVVKTRSHFLGPIPKTEANVRLLKALGGGVPGNALLVPILAMGRVVNVLYADAGRGALVDGSGVGELLILATRIAKSYEALLERVE